MFVASTTKRSKGSKSYLLHYFQKQSVHICRNHEVPFARRTFFLVDSSRWNPAGSSRLLPDKPSQASKERLGHSAWWSQYWSLGTRDPSQGILRRSFGTRPNHGDRAKTFLRMMRYLNFRLECLAQVSLTFPSCCICCLSKARLSQRSTK